MIINGTAHYTLIEPTNVGVDINDTASADDIIVREIHLPVDKAGINEISFSRCNTLSLFATLRSSDELCSWNGNSICFYSPAKQPKR